MGREGDLKEIPGGSALLAAGVQDGPDVPVPLSTCQGSASLRDASVDDGCADAPFGGVVRRGHGGIKQEPKNGHVMFAEAFGQRRRLRRQVALVHENEDAFFDPQHASIESISGNLVAQMPDVKKLFELD